MFSICTEFKEQSVLSNIHHSPEMLVHHIQPGSGVLIKAFFRKSKLGPVQEGPCAVLLCAYFAFKYLGKEN